MNILINIGCVFFGFLLGAIALAILASGAREDLEQELYYLRRRIAKLMREKEGGVSK